MLEMTDKRGRMAGRDKLYPQRVRLFRNERLERMTLVTPSAFALTWFAVLAFAIFMSWKVVSVPSSIGLVTLGLAIWTLFEYAMHRFIFHMKLRSKLGRWLMHLTHGNHHVAPGDRYRNMMPPVASLAINGTVWTVFLVLLGHAGSVLFVGFAGGYIIYDSVHYACHQLPMRGPLLKRLRQHHVRHHYIEQDGNYAITAIFWDRVFGTQVPVKARRSAVQQS